MADTTDLKSVARKGVSVRPRLRLPTLKLMGCDKYYMADDQMLLFSEGNDDVGCLCTFPHNDGNQLSPERVRSLAYLGATLVLLNKEEIDNGYIPSCLPDWIKQEIDRIVMK